jgi:hypothetical protein
MTRDQMIDIAHGALANAECNPETDSGDAVYDECYTLAFDKLVDCGVSQEDAGSVAREIAMGVAHP